MKTHERIAAVVSIENARAFGLSNPERFLSTSVILNVEGKQVKVSGSTSDKVRKKRILSAMGLNGNNARSKAAGAELMALYGKIQAAVDKSVAEYRFDKESIEKKVRKADEKIKRNEEIRRRDNAVEAVRFAFKVHGHLLTTDIVHKLWNECVTKGVMES